MQVLGIEDLEDCFRKLIAKFRNQPDFFYSESDMQCYLYHLLYEYPVLQKTYITKDNMEISTLHNEYPTYGKYVKENGLLKPSERGRRGHFDLAILDQSLIEQQKGYRQRILFAIEMALDTLSWEHFRNDLTKLTDPRNNVTYGYILWFLRNEWSDSAIVEERGRQLCAQHPNIKWFYEKHI